MHNPFRTPSGPAPELHGIGVHGSSRAAFLLRATLAVAGSYGALAAGPTVRNAFAQNPTKKGSTDDIKIDIRILNFALVLEYLESTYYTRGLRMVKGLSDDQRKLVRKLGEDETAHAETIEQKVKDLGGMPAQRPRWDFTGPFSNAKTFMATANAFEDTGVSAYNGAAPMLYSREVRAFAGTIVQVEGRHAALVRLDRGEPVAPRPFDKASSAADVLVKVKPYIKP